MRPTPLQARTLRLLASDPGIYVQSWGRGRGGPRLDIAVDDWAKDPTAQERYFGFPDARAKADIRRLRYASILAMEAAGWLVSETPGDDNHYRRLLITPAGREIVELLGPEDFEDQRRSRPELVPLDLIQNALKDRWPQDAGWLWFWELAAGRKDRRLDGLAINRWSSRAYERMAVEIKRSRGDFLAELKQPEKRQQTGAAADRFWIVTPAGLIEPPEVPGDCGLVWVDEDGRAIIKRRAPRKAEKAPTDRRLLGVVLTYMVDRPAQRERREAMRGNGGI